jgi:hypothetical protein
MAIVSQMGPMIAEGPIKLMILMQNPSVGLVSPRANRAMDKVTQRVASSWYFLKPRRGDLASSNFVFES